ncbi:MAG TPA: alkaline phosphatase [Verrucomicrobiota bacterium]|nr:alkaline phosphatase [Verrucomicrobiales bacterium]HRI14665.1 alkaline phosphatase [Verrucomicrobiota bacterium]
MNSDFVIWIRRVCLAGALVVAAGSASVPLAAVSGVDHVVVIGVDGLGALAFLETNAPVMHSLMREGAWTLKARGVIPTSSSPNWASMICGAGPEQHGVTSNDWQTNKFEIEPTARNRWGYFPTIFGALREQRPQASQVIVHDWQDFGRLVEPGVPDAVAWVKGSPLTTERAAAVIKEQKPTFLFIHFDDVDHAGHGFGWKSPQYYKSVDMVDSLIGDILHALADAGIRERTLILITADHGGVGTKHGGMTQAEIEIPWILQGPGVFRGRELKGAVNTYDTAATLAYVWGLQAPSVWIGRPVLEAFSNP